MSWEMDQDPCRLAVGVCYAQFCRRVTIDPRLAQFVAFLTQRLGTATAVLVQPVKDEHTDYFADTKEPGPEDYWRVDWDGQGYVLPQPGNSGLFAPPAEFAWKPALPGQGLAEWKPENLALCLPAVLGAYGANWEVVERGSWVFGTLPDREREEELVVPALRYGRVRGTSLAVRLEAVARVALAGAREEQRLRAELKELRLRHEELASRLTLFGAELQRLKGAEPESMVPTAIAEAKGETAAGGGHPGGEVTAVPEVADPESAPRQVSSIPAVARQFNKILHNFSNPPSLTDPKEKPDPGGERFAVPPAPLSSGPVFDHGREVPPAAGKSGSEPGPKAEPKKFATMADIPAPGQGLKPVAQHPASQNWTQEFRSKVGQIYRELARSQKGENAPGSPSTEEKVLRLFQERLAREPGVGELVPLRERAALADFSLRTCENWQSGDYWLVTCERNQVHVWLVLPRLRRNLAATLKSGPLWEVFGVGTKPGMDSRTPINVLPCLVKPSPEVLGDFVVVAKGGVSFLQ